MAKDSPKVVWPAIGPFLNEPRQVRLRRTLVWVIAVISGGALAWVAGNFLPSGVDWHYVIRPGALSLLAGQSPYAVLANESAPPWALLALLPLAILPEALGRGVLFVISLGVIAYGGIRLGAKPVALACLLLSPPVLHGLLNGTLEWIVVLGCLLPPPIGMFLLAVKPQIGIAVAVFWIVEALRTRRVRALASLVIPISAAYLLSFLIFGFWLSGYTAIAQFSTSWNASLWPGSIPVGLALLMYAVRRRSIRSAMAASPCLSPYVLFHSWVIALITVVNSTPETIAAVAGLWIMVGLKVFNL